MTAAILKTWSAMKLANRSGLPDGEVLRGHIHFDHQPCCILFHIAGLRVSEIAALSWRQLQPRTDGGQVTVFGKGDKTRVVLLPAAIWRELLCFRQGADLDAPLFPVPPRRWPPRSDGGAADRQEGGETRWPGGKCLAALTAPQPRHACARARRADPPGAGDTGHASVASMGRYLHARPTDSSSRYLAV